jgi:hypothetical protein
MNTTPSYLSVQRVESVIQVDYNQRGIDPIFVKDELYASATALLACQQVVIITGFPCLLDFPVKTETDGPLGMFFQYFIESFV